VNILRNRNTMTGEILTGHYFPYCQICKHDGSCELKHYEFLGIKPKGEIDRTAYQGHEDIEWHLTAFQGSDSRGNRGACTGRIHATGSIFYPLACGCGTVISSLTFSTALGAMLCQKYEFDGSRVPEKVAEAREKGKRWHKSWLSLLLKEILDNTHNSGYDSVMRR